MCFQSSIHLFFFFTFFVAYDICAMVLSISKWDFIIFKLLHWSNVLKLLNNIKYINGGNPRIPAINRNSITDFNRGRISLFLLEALCILSNKCWKAIPTTFYSFVLAFVSRVSERSLAGTALISIYISCECM